MWLSLGGFAEKNEKLNPQNKIYNTHILINSSGEIS